MKKQTLFLFLVSNLIWAPAFANETPQNQTGENPQVIKFYGKLEKNSGGYVLITEVAGLTMLMVPISQHSGEQFGPCAEGAYLVDLDSKKEDGVKILAMDCVKR